MLREVSDFAVAFVDRNGGSAASANEDAREVADRFVEAEPSPASLAELRREQPAFEARNDLARCRRAQRGIVSE